MTILLSGATGKIGRHVVDNLLAAGKDVRALSRRPDRAGLPPEVTVVEGDLTVPESLTAALDGVESAFLFPVLEAIPDFVASAKRAGVQRIVLFTGAWAAGHTERDIGSWVYPRYRAAEAALESSGVAQWTILRPAPFQTNMLWWASSVRAESVVRAPYPAATCPLIHEADIAAVAALALTEDGHHGARYTLTGPAAVSQTEQVAAISGAIGREIRFEELTADQWRESTGKFLRPGIVGDLLREWSETAADPSCALPVLTTVEELTGKRPRSVDEWAADHAADFA
ncbi:NAD(P)H-binding protein [Streptomyces sp. APSN-46.1]|uniref:NAD(P)H-binding protein n=1 Tax=Streptomyces sp. APSN-46.1 TaxID=2929049 RepID=UPI001FB1BC92|nr:NAD(P)H-binding protein [Streptomyces sp. APSN-46.1]MCJ1680434.1 NAD(P)H-binding protein [Streptomyces sp. APSN-46.1]